MLKIVISNIDEPNALKRDTLEKQIIEKASRIKAIKENGIKFIFR